MHLIVVEVARRRGRKYVDYGTGEDAEYLEVDPGDSVAWFVRSSAGNPGYEIRFTGASPFGRKKRVSVPDGGLSEANVVTAKPPKAGKKHMPYTIKLSNGQQRDPEIILSAPEGIP